MTRVDQLLQTIRAAVGILRGKRVDAVVAPITRAGKLRHRHQLDCGDPNVGKPVQMGNDSFECSFGRERANMQLVDEVLFDRQPEPMVVTPLEVRTHDFRRAMHTLRLIA